MIGRFFGVFAEPQSYLNILFLFLGLPLGITYFVFLVAGFSVGVGLVVIWVGAAYGMVVLVFQKGVGSKLFGFQEVPVIES